MPGCDVPPSSPRVRPQVLCPLCNCHRSWPRRDCGRGGEPAGKRPGGMFLSSLPPMPSHRARHKWARCLLQCRKVTTFCAYRVWLLQSLCAMLSRMSIGIISSETSEIFVRPICMPRDGLIKLSNKHRMESQTQDGVPERLEI